MINIISLLFRHNMTSSFESLRLIHEAGGKFHREVMLPCKPGSGEQADEILLLHPGHGCQQQEASADSTRRAL